jgi:hypothetical protein
VSGRRLIAIKIIETPNLIREGRNTMMDGGRHNRELALYAQRLGDMWSCGEMNAPLYRSA